MSSSQRVEPVPMKSTPKGPRWEPRLRDLRDFGRRLVVSRQLFYLLLPATIVTLVFQYVPMYGVVIAFKDFNPYGGVTGSPWVGFKHFTRFFQSPSFLTIIWNTLAVSLYQLLAAFPLPIALALAMNLTTSRRFTRTVQIITYAPHFISTVVLVGMLNIFFTKDFGLVNHLIEYLGGERRWFLGDPGAFRHMYVWSSVWQSMGWNSIIYLASLSSIDPQLHEAAIVDGASRLQRIRHIDLPGIIPTIVILLILNTGRLMSIGFEKAYLMQNPLNLDRSEIIATYVYKLGLLGAQYSFSAAVGLFNAVVNFVLLLLVNRAAKALGQSGLF